MAVSDYFIHYFAPIKPREFVKLRRPSPGLRIDRVYRVDDVAGSNYAIRVEGSYYDPSLFEVVVLGP